jgi:hypothetical protein
MGRAQSPPTWTGVLLARLPRRPVRQREARHGRAALGAQRVRARHDRPAVREGDRRVRRAVAHLVERPRAQIEQCVAALVVSIFD